MDWHSAGQAMQASRIRREVLWKLRGWAFCQGPGSGDTLSSSTRRCSVDIELWEFSDNKLDLLLELIHPFVPRMLRDLKTGVEAYPHGDCSAREL